MVLIYYLSSIPNLKIDDTKAEFWRRKFVHLFEYGLLWCLIYRALGREEWLTKFRKNFSKIILSIFITTLYGASDEIHQLFVPTRDGKITDLLTDSLGGVLGASLVNCWSLKKENQPTKKSPKQFQMPLWPLLLGFIVIITVIVAAFLYYQSYCPAI